jgi:hypothetical protein
MGFTYSDNGVRLSRDCVPVAAFRYDAATGTFQPLGNVKPTEVQRHDGARHSIASFQYIMGNEAILAGDTTWFDDVLPLRRIGNPNVVQDDERVVVASMGPDGNLVYMFDGFVTKPEANFSGNRHGIEFNAVGVEFRLMDEPLPDATYRDASDPFNPTKNVMTGLPLHFNPVHDYVVMGNMTAPGYEANVGGLKYPVFVEPKCRKTISVGGSEVQAAQRWDLAGIVKYLLATGNPDQSYVKNEDFKYIGQLMKVYKPKNGNYYDPARPSTYTTAPIRIPTIDLATALLPDALERVLGANGFAMRFEIGTGPGGLPETRIMFERINDPMGYLYTDVYLQQFGETIDPARSNVGSSRLAYDVSNIVNEIRVDTDVVDPECGLVTAPMFQPDPADIASNEAKDAFKHSSPTFKQNKNKYRLFGIDEIGEGHLVLTRGARRSDGSYPIGSATWSTDPFNFDDVLGRDPVEGPYWVPRLRPADDTLWSKDEAGDYLKYELWISSDYAGPVPGVWDGSGTWHKCKGGFANHKERCGIWINVERPNAWRYSDSKRDTKPPLAGGEVRVMDWLASTNPETSQFFALMFLCKVRSDDHLGVYAGRRPVSPTSFTIARTIDQRTKYKPGLIHPSSKYAPAAAPTPVGNELQEAIDFAIAKREMRQLGVFAGQWVIPRITFGYRIGQRVRRIVGRDMDLQTNSNANGAEAPVYPRIVGITWRNDDHQSTFLIPSDHRTVVTAGGAGDAL